MFSITDNERLRDAYALLMFMQSDVPASAEKKAAVKNMAVTIKREIRNYNNRPAPDVHIICADYDGRLELVQLPDELDKAHKADAADWFRGNCYLEAYNSPYDCTGQEFTNWFYICSGGAVTGLHITRLAEMFKEEVTMTDEKAIEKMLYDQQQGWPLCPRCGERMPDKLTHGALSRHANGVYICEACGTDEALRDWTGNVKPLSDWVLVRVYNGDLRR